MQHTHKHTGNTMLTINFFDSLRTILSRPHDNDIRRWANIEYKNDAEYAYTQMKENGSVSEVGVKL